MSDEISNTICVFLLLAFAIGFVLGGALFDGCANSRWENQLLDNPAQIELIKARVKAERAEQGK